MQRLTDWLTSHLDNVQGYVDDFLVFSATAEEHESHLRQLFQKFHDAGLKINPKKTVLGCSEVKFCGYLISEDGIKPPPEKLEAIKNYPEPTIVKRFEIILGCSQFLQTGDTKLCDHCCTTEQTSAREETTLCSSDILQGGE